LKLLVPAKERERGIDTKGEKQLKSDIKINKQRYQNQQMEELN